MYQYVTHIAECSLVPYKDASIILGTDSRCNNCLSGGFSPFVCLRAIVFLSIVSNFFSVQYLLTK